MINCPICLEDSKSFVTLECKHNLCLHCFQQCISHNLVRCSICRKNIPEINNILKYINILKTQIEDLEDNISDIRDNVEELHEQILNTEGEKEELQDRFEELWAQIN
jgi:peptidoglycan hydrolase CwlO-like protein